MAMLRSLDDDSYVQTRIAQYQASLDERTFTIAKSLITAKLESQNIILCKYGLEPHLDDFRGIIDRSEAKSLELFRRRLTGIEGKHTQRFNLLKCRRELKVVGKGNYNWTPRGS